VGASRLATLDMADLGVRWPAARTGAGRMRGECVRGDGNADAPRCETETEVDVFAVEEIPLVEAIHLGERGARHEKARARQGRAARLSARHFAEMQCAADPEFARQ